MKVAPFVYRRATTVDEAVSLLAEHGPGGGRILAGGQSLLPLMALRLAQPASLIDINRVPFGDLRVEAGALCIPATVRHEAMATSPAPPTLGSALGRVAAHVAHLPIRSRGTFCGSLAHADPSAEWPLVFATLGGSAVARSVRGTRSIPADAFIRDIMTTALEPDEVLVEARLDLPHPDARLGFSEVSRRHGDYAMAMAFVCLEMRGRVIARARVGVGGAEPRARRIAEAEAALEGVQADEAVFARAADAAADTIEPMEDAQSDAALRRDQVRAVVRRALRKAAA